jgi:hypothetical protein
MECVESTKVLSLRQSQEQKRNPRCGSCRFSPRVAVWLRARSAVRARGSWIASAASDRPIRVGKRIAPCRSTEGLWVATMLIRSRPTLRGGLGNGWRDDRMRHLARHRRPPRLCQRRRSPGIHPGHRRRRHRHDRLAEYREGLCTLDDRPRRLSLRDRGQRSRRVLEVGDGRGNVERAAPWRVQRIAHPRGRESVGDE